MKRSTPVGPVFGPVHEYERNREDAEEHVAEPVRADDDGDRGTRECTLTTHNRIDQSPCAWRLGTRYLRRRRTSTRRQVVALPSAIRAASDQRGRASRLPEVGADGRRRMHAVRTTSRAFPVRGDGRDACAVTAVEVLAVPLDSGQLDVRMASGVPLLAHAVDGATVHQLVPAGVWRLELRTTFAAHQLVAAAVSDAAGRGSLPVVVAGDCSMAVAAVAGLGTEQRVGVLWMDAHGDFNTPETDVRGYLDGQGLAMLVGRCWIAHTTALEGIVPVPEQRVLLAGARDLDPLERAALEASPIARLEVRQWRDGLWEDAVDAFCQAVDAVHVHLDIDVLDPSFGIANDYAAADGVRPGDVTALVRSIAGRRPIVSLSFASWDRDREDAGALVDIVPRLVRELVRAAG